MKRLHALLILVLVFASLATATAFADNGGRPLSTTLSGAEEVNAQGVPNQGDPDGTGTATFRLNHGQGEICYELTVENIAPATAAHIHKAPAGSNGGVVVPLNTPTDGASSGCATVDRALIKDIMQNPEAYYVNVHNADRPAGIIRGQLSK